MRLDKFLVEAGIGSRTEVKQLLKKKQVLVNGKVEISPKTQIDEKADQISCQGQMLSYEKYVYYMLNKPKGVISATEDNHHKTVIDLLNNNYKTYDIFPIGRLDIDTEGLLLLKNDGVLSHNLLSPKKHVDKKYYVKIARPLSESDIKKLENGIKLEENFITKNAKIEIIKNNFEKNSENFEFIENKKTENNIKENENLVYITISEGKFHQVKRMFKAVGNEVLYLKRLKMGNLWLDESLELGKYRELTEEELNSLKS